MTGSSFRGPPDESIACVRVEPRDVQEGIRLVVVFDVVAYFPRGRRGNGPRARWVLHARQNEQDATDRASALSDLLWHAREDGVRAVDPLAKSSAFPVEHGTSVPKVSVAMRGRDLPPVPFRVYFHATKPPDRRYFGTVKCVGMETIEVAWDDDPDPVTIEKREDLGARIQLVPSALPTPEEYHATMTALDAEGRPSCVCGDRGDGRVLHRTDGPCYRRPAPPPAPPRPPVEPTRFTPDNPNGFTPKQLKRRNAFVAFLFGRRS